MNYVAEIKSSNPHFEDHLPELRRIAAEALGLLEISIALTDLKTDRIIDEGVIAAETAEVIHRFRATFSPRRPDRDRPVVEPDPPKAVWPSDRLPRGARMHAIVPGPDGAPMQANLISDGENLVEIDSAAGLAVLALMTAR